MENINIAFQEKSDLVNSLVKNDDNGTGILEKKLISFCLEKNAARTKVIFEDNFPIEDSEVDLVCSHLSKIQDEVFFDIHLFDLNLEGITISGIERILKYRSYLIGYLRQRGYLEKESRYPKFRIKCHLIGSYSDWTEEEFNIMAHLQSAFDLYNHEYYFNPLKGLCFNSYRSCEKPDVSRKNENLDNLLDCHCDFSKS
ncbi:hypothetical protein MATR_09920 [Marivirga tractuosa]|uniref:Uncharacterized protein n=1 Tax=Marivirga tractuosa (strain ATCC 23168 / DSM 4126 / NBRC 15989 / NCIMB 1408 / VKM B-1430 / H-43) TaxID=643867 RepID=E4TMU8_MARTH|nr:hypothetical protein [Marivirga tractuosa]ADR21379.1 hypothetical protein Ftrac_1389 [Marivirga tractuosa DSM 4126]BDD14167.1 hypothetical protein MATR_09920 [Marivirga tractuosa]